MRAVLTFHSIDDSGSVLSYPVRAFERLLSALDRSNLPIMDIDALLLPETTRGIALTFDDGIRSVFDAALPILRDHAVPAHLFLTTGFVGKTNRWPSQPASAPLFEMLRWPEVEALQRAGTRIEAHTDSHPDLRRLSDEDIAAECGRADATITARLGSTARYFAYPYGAIDARVVGQLRHRYRANFTTALRTVANDDDPSALPRIDGYYLRPDWMLRNMASPVTRSYLALRRVLRHMGRSR